ncbi:MAG: serine hydrolase domain-containing protein [Pseudomonadota bacterium]
MGFVFDSDILRERWSTVSSWIGIEGILRFGLWLRRNVFLSVGLLLLFKLLVLPASASDTALLTALDEEIADIISTTKTPGVAITVLEDGRNILEKGYGFADLGAKTPMRTDTILAAGSLSKNLTSLGLLRLVELGKLDLKDKITDVAPEVRIDNPWASQHPILLEHLLEHTAGIEGSTYFEYGYNSLNTKPKDYAQLMAGKLKVRWPPGYFHSYANPGHTLAAVALENACSCDFDEFMEKEIFSAIGMSSASFRSIDSTQMRLAKSYRQNGTTPIVPWRMAIRPSGSLLVSIEDLGALVAFYANRGGETGLVSEHWLDRMEKAKTSATFRAGIVETGYGLGNFAFFAEKGITFHGHTGATDGFRTWLGYQSGLRSGFAIVTNGGDENMRYRLMRLISQYLTRNEGEVAPLPAEEGAEDFVDDGWYAPVTHSMILRTWLLRSFQTVKLTAKGNRLTIDPVFPFGTKNEMIHVGTGLFREEWNPTPTAAFIDGPNTDPVTIKGIDGRVFVKKDAFVRISLFQAYVSFFLLVGGLFFGALVSIGVILKLSLNSISNQSNAHTGRLWLCLAGAGGSLVILFATVVVFGMLSDLDVAAQYGRISPMSLSAFAMSIVGPIFSVLAMITVFKQQPSSRFSKIAVGLCLFFVGGSWMMVGINGWVPLVTWLA